MKLLLPRIVIAGALIAICLPGPSAGAQPAGAVTGPPTCGPSSTTPSMLVLRIRMAPHEKTAMHELSARLVIWLTDAHLRDTNYRTAR